MRHGLGSRLIVTVELLDHVGSALTDPRGHGKAHRLFDKAEMKAFARRAEVLNRKGEGDQVGLVLAPR